MEILYIIAALLFVWFFARYRRLKYLAEIIELIETDYIKLLKDSLERRVYSKKNEIIDFREIYKNHFNSMIKNAEKEILEYKNNPIFNKELEVCIQVKYSWINAYSFFKDKKVSNYISMTQEDRDNYNFYINAEVCNYLWLIEYLKEYPQNGFYETKEILESLNLSLTRDLVGFSSYMKNKNIVWSLNKITENFDKKDKPYLLRFLELLKYQGEHCFDDDEYRDIKLFTGKEIEELNSKIDIFFTKEVLKHNFKYIGQLIHIIQEIKDEYRLDKYNIQILTELNIQLYSVSSSLILTAQKK